MDKKSIVALVLIGVILFGYSWWSSTRQKKQMAEMAIADSIDRAQHPERYSTFDQMAEQTAGDSLATAEQVDSIEQSGVSAEQAEYQARVNHFGQELVDSEQGEEREIVLENNLLKATLSTKGAMITEVELKDYKRYDKKNNGAPIEMFADGSAKFDVQFYLRKNYNYALVNTSEYYFVTDAPQTLTTSESDSTKTVTMRLPVSEGSALEMVYTITEGSYMIDFNIRFVEMKKMVESLTDFTIFWSNTSLQNEKGYKNENTYTTISYLYPDAKKMEDLGMADTKRGGGVRNKNINARMEWFAFKQQFFSSVLIADQNDLFQNGEFEYSTYAEGTGKIKDFKATVSVPFSASESEYGFRFYFGPNKFSELKSYDLGLEKLVPLGGWLVKWVNRWIVIPVFDFLHKYIGNFGLIILLLTIFIKLLILPLTYKSYMSSAKMRVLKPEVDQINEKYPKQEDAMKKQQATMDLYKRCGVSPMGGCLPMLIQFPILIAMFRFFPASIELRGQRFLWAEDLSAYDSVLNLPFNIPWYGDHVSLFALIMTVTLFFYSRYNYEQTQTGGQQMAGMKFMMVYLMPIMMLMWMNNYASGLCYYYFLSQLFTMVQMWGFKYLINEDKLHAQLTANAGSSKKKKKSKWQLKLEQMQREQAEVMRQQQRRR